MHKSSVQDAFQAALKETKINKAVSVHTLRHYAEFQTMPSGLRTRVSIYLSAEV